MAELYGRLRGRSKEVTREGSKTSGLRTLAETWNAKVEVDLQADGTCTVTLMRKSQRTGKTLWAGNIDEAVEDL